MHVDIPCAAVQILAVQTSSDDLEGAAALLLTCSDAANSTLRPLQAELSKLRNKLTSIFEQHRLGHVKSCEVQNESSQRSA